LLDPDYPRPYTRIIVESIDHPSSAHKATTEKLKAQINQNASSAMGLTQMVGGLERVLNQYLQKVEATTGGPNDL